MRTFLLTCLACAGLLASSGCWKRGGNGEPTGGNPSSRQKEESERGRGAQEAGDTAGRQANQISVPKVQIADGRRAPAEFGDTAGRATKNTTPIPGRGDPRVVEGRPKSETNNSPEVRERLELYQHKWGDMDQLVATNRTVEGTISDRFREAIRSSLVSDVREYTRRIDAEHDRAEAHLRRGWAQQRLGRYRAAIDDFERAREIDSSFRRSEFVLGDGMALAWLLAVCPDHAFRDGRRALRIAKFGCEETRYENAAFLDTLAAAYAETGDFENAIQWQSRACQMKPNPNFEKRLELYRQHHPYREQPME
jgi:tetratricopeptide (TPR) repeat protein